MKTDLFLSCGRCRVFQIFFVCVYVIIFPEGFISVAIEIPFEHLWKRFVMLVLTERKYQYSVKKTKATKKNGVGDIYRHSIINLLGFPSDPAGKEPTCQCRRCKRLRFDLWVGKTPQEKEMATCSSVLAFLAWKILETEPGWLQSMGLQSWTWLSVPAHTLWVFYLFWLHPEHWVTEQPRRISIRLSFLTSTSRDAGAPWDLWNSPQAVPGSGLHRRITGTRGILEWPGKKSPCE